MSRRFFSIPKCMDGAAVENLSIQQKSRLFDVFVSSRELMIPLFLFPMVVSRIPELLLLVVDLGSQHSPVHYNPI